MRLPNEEHDLLSDANEVYGSPTIPDDVRRIWDSQRLSEDDLGIEVSDLQLYLSDFDVDFDDYQTFVDDLGSDNDLEVALEECPFDFDELADNMIDSGPEF